MAMAEEFANQHSVRITGRAGGRDHDVTLVIGRIDARVHANFSAWCRDVVAMRCRQVAASLPEDGRKVAIERGVDIAVNDCDFGGKTYTAMAVTPLGIAKLVHLSLSAEQQRAVSVDELVELLPLADQDELNRKILLANGVTAAELGRPNPPEAAAHPSTGGPSSAGSLGV